MEETAVNPHVDEENEEEGQQISLSPFFAEALSVTADGESGAAAPTIDLGLTVDSPSNEPDDMTQASSEPPAPPADPMSLDLALPDLAMPDMGEADGATQISDAAALEGTTASPMQQESPAEEGVPFTSEAPISEFVQMSGAGPATNRRKNFILVAVSIAALGLAGLLLLDPEDDSMSLLMETLGLVDPAPTVQPQVRRRTKPKVAKPAQAEPEVVEVAKGQVPENPYWDLPNKRLPLRAAQKKVSFEEQSVLSAGMNHKFTYQRYKTISEIRKLGLSGSPHLLRKALAEKKLWLRMNAVMGLADFGEPVDVDMVELAIGNARSSLIANYFRRFKKQRTEGDLVVMREAIKVVDARARRNILEVLDRAGGEMRGLYLVAATYDPGAGIEQYARLALARRPLAKDVYERYRNIVLGLASYAGSAPETKPRAVTPDAAPPPSSETALQKEISAIEFHSGQEDTLIESEKVGDEVMDDDGFEDLDFIEIGEDSLDQ